MKETTKKSVNVLGFITKYAMVIALVVVFALFAILTDGRLLNASNMSNLMLQNGYVLVMACGMLLGVALILHEEKRCGKNEDDYLDLCIYTSIFAVIGWRL